MSQRFLGVVVFCPVACRGVFVQIAPGQRTVFGGSPLLQWAERSCLELLFPLGVGVVISFEKQQLVFYKASFTKME